MSSRLRDVASLARALELTLRLSDHPAGRRRPDARVRRPSSGAGVLGRLGGRAPVRERLDGRKRKLIDDALDGAAEDVAERVRDAVLQAEQAGARWRFEKFVLEH